jgi:flagellar hook assembly protein FlgD
VTIRIPGSDGKTRQQLRIYDATGCLVHSVNIPQTAHGLSQTITWNGKDDSGRKLPTGIREKKSE